MLGVCCSCICIVKVQCVRTSSIKYLAADPTLASIHVQSGTYNYDKLFVEAYVKPGSIAFLYPSRLFQSKSMPSTYSWNCSTIHL